MTDDEGNSFVTGCSHNGANYDDLTIRYDSSGAMVWQRRWAATVGSGEAPEGLVLDAAGNVIVSGLANQGVVTVKYSRDGVEQWQVLRASNSATVALAADGVGNIVVASMDLDPDDVYRGYLVQYDSAGLRRWESRLPNGLVGYGSPLLVAAGERGEVVVTGLGYGDRYAQWLTAKFDAAGRLRWVARYSDEFSGGSASEMALDVDGAVVITGTIEKTGTNRYLTVRYDHAGNLLWSRTYGNGQPAFAYANALALDRAGGIYVTGRASNDGIGSQVTTVKYDRGGQQQWVARHPRSEGHFSDEGYDVTAATQGGVFVAGLLLSGMGVGGSLIAHYNTAGDLLWSRVDGSAQSPTLMTAVTTDVRGNAYSWGGRFTGARVGTAGVRYDVAGNPQWITGTAPESGFSEALRARTLATDPDGNAYLANAAFNGGGTDLAVLKIDPAGQLLWRRQYAWPLAGYGEVYAIAVDAAAVYVVAQCGPSTAPRSVLIKLASDGGLVWQQALGDPVNGDLRIDHLGLDPQGSLRVAGTLYRVDRSSHYQLYSLDATTGSLHWEAQYTGSAGRSGEALAMELDATGNTYLTGQVRTANGGWDFGTAKFDRTGRVVWAREFNGTEGAQDTSRALAIGHDGSLAVAGISGSRQGGANAAIVRYDSEGTQLWAAEYDGPQHGYDMATALALDPAGNVYVAATGYRVVPYFNSSEFTTLKYAADGTQQWVAHYLGEDGMGRGAANDLLLSVDGTVYVTGELRHGPRDIVAEMASADLAVVQYASDGRQIGSLLHDGAHHQHDVGRVLKRTADGRVLVAGTVDDGLETSRVVVMQLESTQ